MDVQELACSLELSLAIFFLWYRPEVSLFFSLLLLLDHSLGMTKNLYDHITSYFKRKTAETMTQLVFKFLDSGIKNMAAGPRSARIVSQCLEIPFTYQGSEYTIVVPYSRRWNRKVRFEGFNCYGSLDLNFHPCLPIVALPSQMGFDALAVIESANKRTIYKGNEQPLLPAQVAPPPGPNN